MQLVTYLQYPRRPHDASYARGEAGGPAARVAEPAGEGDVGHRQLVLARAVGAVPRGVPIRVPLVVNVVGDVDGEAGLVLRQVAHIQHLALQVIPVNKRRAYTKFGYICLTQYATYSNSLNLGFRKILQKNRKL